MLNLRQIKENGFSLKLAWDLFMVVLLMLNLFLMVFDMTYFLLRPYYFRFVPAVSAAYDPVKGIQPHPVTRHYQTLAAALFTAWRVDGILDPARIQELADYSKVLVRENPFTASGQNQILAKIIRHAAKTLEKTPQAMKPYEVLQRFWRQLTPGNAPSRHQVYFCKIRPLLAVNFQRERAVSGEYVDRSFSSIFLSSLFFWKNFCSAGIWRSGTEFISAGFYTRCIIGMTCSACFRMDICARCACSGSCRFM